jgi:exoribonuclease R
VLKYKICPTVIRSNYRLSYDQAQEILDGIGDFEHLDEENDPLRKSLGILNALARILRKNRLDKGAVSFERDEVKFDLDEHGKPLAIHLKPSKEANFLIEEFMLLANRKVAEFGAQKAEFEDKNGRKKIGDKGSMQLSEEFARMAAQQEMIRRMMQQYGQEMKQENAGNAKLAKEIEQMMRQMEQTENDLVNKVITQQTINRQNQIMTRLLEHEKAEMQREKEERRESHEGNDKARQQTQSEIEQYQRLKEKNMELFRTVPPTLSRYYMDKVNDYFYNF